MNRIAAGVRRWARSARARLRRADVEEEAVAAVPVAAGAGEGIEATGVEDERRASADLLAIDQLVRAFHRARPVMGPGSASVGVARLLAGDARLDLQDGGGREFAERSRTVHVIGDFAIVISSYEIDRPGAGGLARGVVFLQLRLAREGWRVHDAVARSVDRALTERCADPRPLAARRLAP